MNKKICVLQDDLKDCGVSSLLTIIKYYNGDVTKEYLRELTYTTKDGVNAYNLVKAAQQLGFSTKAVKGNINDLPKDNFPLIAHVIINKSLEHFLVVYEVNEKYILVADPGYGIKKIKIEEWNNISTNKYLIFKPITIIPKIKKEKNIFKFILDIFLKYRNTFIIVILFSFIYTILNIVVSYNFKLLMDYNDILTLKYMLYILLFLGFNKIITNYLRNKLINYINQNIDNNLVEDLYNHIVSLPYLYYKNRTCGEIVTRINDISNIKDLISKIFVTVFIDVVFLIMIIIVLFNINTKLTLIAILISLLYILLALKYNQKICNLVNDSYKEATNVNSYLVESINSIETIKGLNVINYVKEKMKKKYHSFTNNNLLIVNLLSKENFYKEIITYFGTTLIMYYGIKLINNGMIEVTTLIAFITLISYYLEPISNIIELNYVYNNSLMSIKRIMELYYIKNENYQINKNNKEIIGNINFNNVSFSYNGINNILNNINLKIIAKEKVLICGGSGKGKSTLVKLLARFMDNYEGNIFIDNMDIKDYDLGYIRDRVCYVSQNENLFTDTIYNNIVLDNKVRFKKIKEISKIVCIEEIIKKLPLKYNTLLEENGCNLSGGERQRLILARTLIKDRDVYILDEALSQVDINTERIILKNIFDYLKDKTVIIISHRFNNNDLFERIIDIGKIDGK